MKRCFIIAGPNGAGKTTFAKDFLPKEGGGVDFINADLIAEGLSPFYPEKAALEAGRIMLKRIEQAVELGESFAFESTLSGLAYIQRVKQWKAKGYQIVIYFLSLPNEEMAIDRVRLRVLKGGHNVPEEVVAQRFRRGRLNFETHYKPLADEWVLFDNSNEIPVVLERSR